MTVELEALESLKGDEKIIAEAQMRFRRCEEWEGYTRPLNIEDLKFADGDSDNGYQWPASITTARGDRPCLTINKVRQHNLQIINDAKQNKPSIKIRPVGDGATYDAAQVYEGVIRHIEYISNAQVAYDTATSFQVKMGVGYARVITDYEHDDTFNQEIYIRRITNPLDVYPDPDCQEKDGSDAKFGFIFKNIPTETFNKDYPKYKDYVTNEPLGNGENWLTEDHVRIAEYYRCTEKADKLWALPDPKTGEINYVRKSIIPREVIDALIKERGVPEERDITDYGVEWFLIVGNKIAEKKDWPGKTIPIVPLIGEQIVIDGVMDRKGHTRGLKDAQRMYNYNASAAVEYGALQSKTPYVAPAAAIEGFETFWDNANETNYSFLPYNHLDDDGNEIPKPERQQGPTGAPIYIEGMMTADQQMMMASGQYEANLGRKSNEVSGKAIDARERNGDDATYHFIDNQAIFIRRIGKICLELIPKVYDVERVIKIQAEDGEQSDVTLDPQAKQAHQMAQHQQEEEAKIIFNPNVGKYDVMADVGPAYATKRQEAFNAFSQIAAKSPELMGVIGDLLFKSADFPGADKIAERLERMVPAQAKGEGASPAEQQAQEQIKLLTGELTKTIQELAEERLKTKAKDADKSVNEFKAITDRLDVLFNHVVVTEKDKSAMLHDVMLNEHQSSLNMAEASHAQAIQPEPANEPPAA